MGDFFQNGEGDFPPHPLSKNWIRKQLGRTTFHSQIWKKIKNVGLKRSIKVVSVKVIPTTTFSPSFEPNVNRIFKLVT